MPKLPPDGYNKLDKYLWQYRVKEVVSVFKHTADRTNVNSRSCVFILGIFFQWIWLYMFILFVFTKTDYLNKQMFYEIHSCMFKFSLFGCFVPMKFGIHEDQSLSLFDTKFQQDPAQNDPKINCKQLISQIWSTFLYITEQLIFSINVHKVIFSFYFSLHYVVLWME